MKINEVISKLNKRLIDYTKSEVYQLNTYPKDIVSMVVIGINIAEIALRNNNKIRKEDHYIFNGEYQVTRLFENPEWEDIGKLYCDFVSIVKEYYY